MDKMYPNKPQNPELKKICSPSFFSFSSIDMNMIIDTQNPITKDIEDGVPDGNSSGCIPSRNAGMAWIWNAN